MTSIDMGSIGQKSRSSSDFELCTVSSQLLYYLLTYDDDTWRMCYLWPVEPILIGVKRSKVQFKFWSRIWALHHFPTKILTFWPAIVVLHTWLGCMHNMWPDEDSYWHWVQRSRPNLESLNLLGGGGGYLSIWRNLTGNQYLTAPTKFVFSD